jgi:hypothetical protein
MRYVICNTYYTVINNKNRGFEMKIRLNITPFEIIMRYSWENGAQRKKNAAYRN